MVKIRVCFADRLPPGKMENFTLLERTVLIANVDGRYYAMDGMCSDAGGNLSRGKLTEFVVECPRHAARFDIRTGKAVKQPDTPGKRVLDLRAYPVTVEEGCIVVDI